MMIKISNKLGTAAIYLDLTTAEYQTNLYGLDIPKPAIEAACKREKHAISWIVASNRSIPLQDNSIDILICMFGFPVFEEFKRVLKPSGKLIMVDTGEQYLTELRELIYDEVRYKQPSAYDEAITLSFTEIASSNIKSQAVLTQSQLQDLLLMTPKAKTDKNRTECLSRTTYYD